MPVLPFQAGLETWFRAGGFQAPLVLVARWEEVQEPLLAHLAPRDFYILTAENHSISIEDIRRLIQATLTTTPLGARLIVLPHAERLTLPAAQALLKFLEEPTAGNRILLVTKFPKRLLPTIRSRVQIVKMKGEKNEKGKKTELFVDPLKLLSSKNRRGLTEEELAIISENIQRRLAGGEEGSATYRTLLRLRDYYKIRSAGGNEKLAADVLLACLVELGSRS